MRKMRKMRKSELFIHPSNNEPLLKSQVYILANFDFVRSKHNLLFKEGNYFEAKTFDFSTEFG